MGLAGVTCQLGRHVNWAGAWLSLLYLSIHSLYIVFMGNGMGMDDSQLGRASAVGYAGLFSFVYAFMMANAYG